MPEQDERYRHYQELVQLFTKKMGMDPAAADVAARNIVPNFVAPARAVPDNTGAKEAQQAKDRGELTRAEMTKIIVDRLAEHGYTRQTGVTPERYPAYSAQSAAAQPYLDLERQKLDQKYHFPPPFPAPASTAPQSPMARRIAKIRSTQPVGY